MVKVRVRAAIEISEANKKPSKTVFYRLQLRMPSVSSGLGKVPFALL